MLGLGLAKKVGLGGIARELIIWREEKEIKKKLTKNRVQVSRRNRRKVFVIGMNKTGTTTLENELKEFGYIVGHQRTAERLFDDVSQNNYDALIEYCKTAEAFQDIPFSMPGVYKVLDQAFPNSLFILTIRDSPEQWFQSLLKFHSKMWGNGTQPTESILANENYVYKGYPLKSLKFVFGENLYHEEHYKSVYIQHNENVREYFKFSANQLLELNVANGADFVRFIKAIGVETDRKSFLWENKT